VQINNIREVKVSQLKSFKTNELADQFLPLYFVSYSSMMFARGFGGRMWLEVGVRWLAEDGGRGGERSKF
jgi:hypothetical protein